jgi:GLPGLI family protein
MKKILSILTIFYLSFSYGQNMELEYLVTLNTNDEDLRKRSLYKLEISKNKSIFYNLSEIEKSYLNQERVIDIQKKKDVNVVWFENSKTDFTYNQKYYTDFSNDSITFNSNVFTRKIVIKDTFKNMKWELVESNNDSTILGYKCQKAITKFRGRTYEAFFTTQIKSNAGPWKFNGLPGLILSVRSLDNYFIIDAVKLKLNVEKMEITNPFKNETVYTWDKYIEYTVKFLKKQLKMMQSTADVEEGSIKLSEGIEDLGISKLSF